MRNIRSKMLNRRQRENGRKSREKRFKLPKQNSRSKKYTRTKHGPGERMTNKWGTDFPDTIVRDSKRSTSFVVIPIRWNDTFVDSVRTRPPQKTVLIPKKQSSQLARSSFLRKPRIFQNYREETTYTDMGNIGWSIWGRFSF